MAIAVDLLTAQSPETYTSGADDEAAAQFAFARDYAEDAYADMQTVMDAVRDALGELTMPDADITYATQTVALASTVAQPTVPTDEFGTVDAPTAPSLYDMALGAFMDMPTGADFDFNEEVYVTRRTAELSALMTSLEAKLQYDITNGGTGLDATVEAAIWSRAQDRSADAYEQADLAVLADCAARGFSLPTGAAGGRQLEIAMENERALAQINHEILIKQAELAQANTHFVIQQSVALETQLMQHFHQLMNRLLEAEKADTDHSMKAFGAQVEAATSMNKSLTDAYNTAIVKYKADTELETAAMEAVIKKFEAQVKMYDSDTKYESAKMQALIDEFKAKIQQETNQTELAIKEAELALQGFLGDKQIRMEVLKAVAGIANQIAASSLSTIQASVGWSTSLSKSNSSTRSFGHDINNSYSESQPHTEIA